jgi:hypothetical protein
VGCAKRTARTKAVMRGPLGADQEGSWGLDSGIHRIAEGVLERPLKTYVVNGYQVLLAFIGALQATTAATPTPMPVFVTDFPGADWLAKTTLGVALITLVVAAVTLWKVNDQISIAREELGAVNQDLANNKRLIDDAFRRPYLGAKFTQQNTLSAPDGNLVHKLTAWIFNSGQRPSFHIRCEILIPQDIIVRPEARTLARRVDGKLYRAYGGVTFPPGVKPDPLFPNAIPLRVEFTFATKRIDSGDGFLLLYSIYDEYGTYPKDQYGRTMAQTTPITVADNITLPEM